MKSRTPANRNRIIFHCDCNAYYASVECLARPELKNVPMAVTGNPENRHGIILAKNQLAKDCGVLTAETIQQAKRKCPDLICVVPHHDRYRDYSRVINRIYLRYTDRVEPFGIDESFLDLTATWQHFANSPVELADQLREIIRRETGLTISVGVSFNKILAKLGSDFNKPDATTVLSPQNWQEIVWPLPVSRLLYVGRVTERKLRQINIRTIGDVARTKPEFLETYLGKHGLMLSECARGLDETEVSLWEEIDESKSIGNGMTFRKDLMTWEEIKSGLHTLIDEVSTRLMKADKLAYVIQVQMKTANFQVFSKQQTLTEPVQFQTKIRAIAYQLMHDLWQEDLPIRLLAVTAANLIDRQDFHEQISFLDGDRKCLLAEAKSNRTSDLEQAAGQPSAIPDHKTEQLETLLFELKQKHGLASVQLGLFKNKEIGVD